MFVFFWVLQ